MNNRIAIGVALLGALIGIFFSEMFMGQDDEDLLIIEGQEIYAEHCLACHQAGGGGVPYLQPSLAGSGVVLGGSNPLARFVIAPPNQPGGEYDNVMPPFDILSDRELAAVLGYIRTSFGNEAGIVSVDSITDLRDSM